MDILEKITNMREERHWTEYQLAEKSGLTQSTISSWYRKNMLPTIPSLIKICDAFGVTLSHFFLDDKETDNNSTSTNVDLTNSQLRLLHAASKLDKNQLEALWTFLDML